MNLKIRGWQRAQTEQTVVDRPLVKMEHRSDNFVFPPGTTRAIGSGVIISFRGRATCSPNSQYLFSLELSDADLDHLQNLCRMRDEENLFGLTSPADI